MTVLLLELVEVEVGSKLMAIPEPMRLEQIDAGALGPFSSAGGESAALLS